MARATPTRVLTGQSISNQLRGQTGDSNHLTATALTGSNSNGGARHLQKICKEFNAGFVGLALDRRRSERNLQSIAQFTRDRVFSCSRMDFDSERYCPGTLVNRNHIQRDHLSACFISHNRAMPIKTAAWIKYSCPCYSPPEQNPGRTLRHTSLGCSGLRALTIRAHPSIVALQSLSSWHRAHGRSSAGP